MEDLKTLIGVIVSIMQFPMEIWGYTLSFWDIMLALLVGGIIITLIVRFFNE